MHPALEKVLQELAELCVGDDKGLDAETESYELQPLVWDAIGRAYAESGKTVPPSSGRCIPNLATKRNEFIAETWLFFSTMVEPALLHGRFKKPE